MKKYIKKFKKMPHRISALLFAVVFAGLGAYVLTVTHAAPIGTFNLTPASSTTSLGSNVSVTLTVNTGTTPVYTAEAHIKYDTTKLQYVSTDTSMSTLDLPVEASLDPSDSSVLRITQGDKTPGTGVQTMAVVTFKTIGTGSAAITIDSGSHIFQSADVADPEMFSLAGSTGSTITINDTTAPTVPSGLVASGTTVNSTTLAWTASSDNVGVTRYDIYQGATKIGSSATNSYTATGLTPSTAYSFKVQAFDAAGNSSAQSTALAVTTLADTTAPSAPTNLTAGSITGTTITLSWTASSDNVGVTRYDVFNGATKIGSPTTNSFTATGLVPNTAYTFKVQAFDAAGNGSTQSSVTATTLADTTAPSAPTNLVVSNQTNTGLTLTWTASTDNIGVTRYDIYNGATKLGSSTTTSFAVTGLVPGSTNNLKVVAFDAAGNSAESTVKTVTTGIKAGDINLDDKIDGTDFSILALNYRKSTATRAMGDLNGDGAVTSADLSILCTYWGQ
jgi:chitodextrinase